jgi:phosphatidylinositol alpha-1,6-mannosyltransferase
LKVLVITNDFSPRVGGINDYVDQIVRRLPSAVVFAADWEGARAFDLTYPHPVVRWGSRQMKASSEVAARAIDIARAERPDVIVFGAAYPLGAIGRRITAATGVPYAGWTHGVEAVVSRAPVSAQLYARVARGAVLLTAVSEWSRRIQRRAVGKTPLELLSPGIDPVAFHAGVDAEHLRARHRLGDGPVIVSVARLVKRKGNDMVIRALPRIAEQHPGVRFVVVGNGPDRARLEGMADERTVFTGAVPGEELPAYFRLGDVFAQPTRHRWLGFEVEAFGIVFIQASAAGRPCIGGNVGGVPEAVDGGGVVVDGRSPDGVARALGELLGDPPRARALGDAGSARVHAELTWDRVAARFVAMLERALGTP